MRLPVLLMRRAALIASLALALLLVFLWPVARSVGEALARGEGELGFQQVSELLHVSGIIYVGPLPAEIQKVTIFSGGIPKSGQDVAVAREFLTFLRSPGNGAGLKKAGLELPCSGTDTSLLP